MAGEVGGRVSELQGWIAIYLAVGMFSANNIIGLTARDKLIAVLIWPIVFLAGLFS